MDLRVLGKKVYCKEYKKSKMLGDQLCKNDGESDLEAPNRRENEVDVGDVELNIVEDKNVNPIASTEPSAFFSGCSVTLPAASPLPAGWQEGVDPKTNAPYFYNQGTQETTWTRPVGDASPEDVTVDIK